MSFIDQIMTARGLPISLFGGNSRGTTPPINPSPNVNTIPNVKTAIIIPHMNGVRLVPF